MLQLFLGAIKIKVRECYQYKRIQTLTDSFNPIILDTKRSHVVCH
jgi:hypothetical protein